jgi:hypothetical protein
MVREMKRIRISSRNENNPKIVPRQAYLSADGLRSADAWEVHMARRSKRSSNQAKRLAKIDQDSRPKIVPLKLDAKALSRMVAGPGTTLPNLPNMQDTFVIQKLATASIGSLPLDHFDYLLCKEKEPIGEDHILDLRRALIRVYFAAAHVRLYARATQVQLESAQAALTSLVVLSQKISVDSC